MKMAGLNPYPAENPSSSPLGEVLGDIMAALDTKSDASAHLKKLIHNQLAGIWLGEAQFFDARGTLRDRFSTRTCLHAMGHLFYHQYDVTRVNDSKSYSGVINGRIYQDGLVEFRSSQIEGYGRLEDERLTVSWKTRKSNLKITEFITLFGDKTRIRIRKFQSQEGFRGWLESRETRFTGLQVYHGIAEMPAPTTNFQSATLEHA